MTSAQFEALFSKWYAPLCRVAFRMVRDKDAAEDLVQEAFVNFWNRHESLDPDIEPKAYLYRSVYNASLNLLNRLKKVSNPGEEVWNSMRADDAADSGILVDETASAIQKGIDALPPGCQEVFMLSRYEGMSYKEIAETREISIKTVEAQMSKALRILKAHLLPFLSVLPWLIWMGIKKL